MIVSATWQCERKPHAINALEDACQWRLSLYCGRVEEHSKRMDEQLHGRGSAGQPHRFDREIPQEEPYEIRALGHTIHGHSCGSLHVSESTVSLCRRLGII
jgi:hypothetical protein